MSGSKEFMSISESCRGGFFYAISGKERLLVDPKPVLSPSAESIQRVERAGFGFSMTARRRMKVFSSKRVSDSCSDNRQSKACAELGRNIQNHRSLLPTIENPKFKIQN